MYFPMTILGMMDNTLSVSECGKIHKGFPSEGFYTQGLPFVFQNGGSSNRQSSEWQLLQLPTTTEMTSPLANGSLSVPGREERSQ